jgi:predicted NBD/HSP70 family sugar kinase
MAGEIGHVIVEPNGELCKCGLRGCLEAIVAGPAIAKQAAQQMKSNHDHRPLTAKDVYTAVQNGDPNAQKIVQRVSYYLSRAIQALIMSYDVDKVVIGGGVTNAGAAFLNPVAEALAELQAQSNLARTMLATDKLRLLPQGYNAGTWGAVYLAQKG